MPQDSFTELFPLALSGRKAEAAGSDR